MFVMALTACGSEPQGVGGVREGAEVELITSHFETYAYQSERVELPASGGFIFAALAHENRIYYASIYIDSQNIPVIVVTSLNTDGSDVRYIEMQSPGNEIASFNITDDGGFAFFLLQRAFSPQGSSLTAHHVEYDYNGTELTRRDWGEFSLIEHPQVNTFALLSDGRVLAINIGENVVCELNFNNRDWGEDFPLSEFQSRIPDVFPTEDNSPFDILISDDFYLYGYSIEDNTQTTLLNWIQSGFSNIHSAQVGIFDDGRIFVLTGVYNSRGEWEAEMYILKPVLINEMPDRITLTLSSMTVPHDVRQAVAAFNRQNALYRIEVYEYVNQADFPAGDITAEVARAIFDNAMTRLQVDFIAGNIPDIICQPIGEMYERGFLLDLNPLIDADPDIDRADFFPNALSAMESPDGKLFSIANTFHIQTIMSRKETLGHIEAWTPAQMLALLREAQEMSLPFGTLMLREDLLRMLLNYTDMGFIDWDNFQASFDNDEFIDLLHTAMLLPSASDLPPDIWRGDIVQEIRQMQRGEQLLAWGFLSRPGYYQYFTDSFEDSMALGLPTLNGGVHIITPYSRIGIGAGTDHAEAAWSFLRGFLLHSAAEFTTSSHESAFPLRIDLFDEIIEDITTPRTFTNAAGEIIEHMRESRYSYDGFTRIELMAMSEKTANSLRNLVESAAPAGRGIDSELWYIIEGDLADFYTGIRSAEETARIIQGRTQIWLSEQELLARG
jgi:hypothetical protein